MNSFFNSLEYITLLELSAYNGNKSATVYKMMSKSRKLLGEKQGVLRREAITKPNKIAEKVVELLGVNKMMSIKTALYKCNSNYYDFKVNFSLEDKNKIYQARNNNKSINQTK